MPHEYRHGETVDGTQEGPIIHGLSSGTSGTVTVFKVDSSGALSVGGLVSETYDYVQMGYTGANITTCVFKTGGSGGTLVASLTLAYSGENMTSVVRS
jgi:hypothetical protein